MATLNEISLLLGLAFSGLFYLQYRKYDEQLRKEEMLDSFLEK